MKNLIKQFVTLNIIILLFCIPIKILSQESASSIVKKMDDYMLETSCKQVVKIEIIRPNWKSEMTVKTWTKDGIKYAMMLIVEPIRDKGVSYLKRSSEAWNWQPSIERTIKLPPSMMMQSWMGSDVNNDDMIKASSIVTDYTHTFLKDTLIEGNSCYVIEAIPKEDASVVWGKQLLYISKAPSLTLITKYYDDDGILRRITYNHDIKKYGNKWYPSWFEVIPTDKKGQKTIFNIVSIEWDFQISESFFSINNLKKIE